VDLDLREKRAVRVFFEKAVEFLLEDLRVRNNFVSSALESGLEKLLLPRNS